MRHGQPISVTDIETAAGLAEWHMLICQCARCERTARLYWSNLRKLVRPSSTMPDIARRLRCTGCRNRQQNRFTVQMIPRD